MLFKPCSFLRPRASNVFEQLFRPCSFTHRQHHWPNRSEQYCSTKLGQVVNNPQQVERFACTLGPSNNLPFLTTFLVFLLGQSFNLLDFQCLISIELEFANIRLQHLECLTAAQIVFFCMRALEDATILLEQDNKR